MEKKIITYILLLPAIVILLLATLSTALLKTALNEKFIESKLEKSNYYKQVYKDIQENFKNNTIQTGLTEDVIEGVISEEKVKEDINNVIRYLYGKDDDTLEIEMQNIQGNLNANIQKQVQENQKNVTKDEQESINIYVDTIMSIYKNQITYSKNDLGKIKIIIEKLTDLLNIIKLCSYISIVILAVVIVFINRKESFSYFATTLVGSGALCILPKIAERVFININNVLLFNKAFSAFIIMATNDVLFIFTFIGAIKIVLGIVLSIIWFKLKRSN